MNLFLIGQMFWKNLKIRNIKTGETFVVEGLPSDLKTTDIEWNPSESAFAFIHSGYDRIDLYQVALSDKKARKNQPCSFKQYHGSPLSMAERSGTDL